MPPGSFWMKSEFFKKKKTPLLVRLQTNLTLPPKKLAFFVNLAVKTKLYLDAPDDPDSSWPDLQAFFDSFPQKHPYYHKVSISDFKIRKEPKTIRCPQYFYGPPTADDDSTVVLSAATTADSSVRRVVREPVSSARQKINNKRGLLSARRRSEREVSSPSTMESDGAVCVSSSRTDEIEVSYQQGRINKIEEGSFLDNVTITEYVLKSDTFQTLLLYGKA